MKTIFLSACLIFTTSFGWSIEVSSPIRLGMISIESAVEPELNLESWMFDSELFSGTKSEKMTVVDIAASNVEFSILVEAVSKAGLAEALSGEGPFTVFAPTNEAFSAFFDKLGVEGIKDLSTDQLIPVLTYHVVAGKVLSTGLSEGKVGTLNEGKSLLVDLSKGVKINSSHVINADISGSNGVIHVVDQVLIPE